MTVTLLVLLFRVDLNVSAVKLNLDCPKRCAVCASVGEEAFGGGGEVEV